MSRKLVTARGSILIIPYKLVEAYSMDLSIPRFRIPLPLHKKNPEKLPPGGETNPLQICGGVLNTNPSIPGFRNSTSTSVGTLRVLPILLSCFLQRGLPMIGAMRVACPLSAAIFAAVMSAAQLKSFFLYDARYVAQTHDDTGIYMRRRVTERSTIAHSIVVPELL